MRSSIISLTVLTVLLASSAVVYAGTIKTPALTRSSSLDQRLFCLVANTTGREIGPYDITIFKFDGTVAESALGISTLAGRTQEIIADDSELGISPFGRCVVKGRGISKNRTPVTLCVVSSTTNDCHGAVSVP